MNVYRPLNPQHSQERRQRRASGYSCWIAMKSRCLNPKTDRYAQYGGRGITIYPQWIESFEAFAKHVGARPSLLHTIGRIDNDGNYEPGNVEWQLQEAQANNKSDSVRVEIDGNKYSLKQLARKAGISHTSMRERYDRCSGNFAQLLRPKETRSRAITFNGETKSLRSWAKSIGINHNSLKLRLDVLHWPLEKALTSVRTDTRKPQVAE